MKSAKPDKLAPKRPVYRSRFVHNIIDDLPDLPRNKNLMPAINDLFDDSGDDEPRLLGSFVGAPSFYDILTSSRAHNGSGENSTVNSGRPSQMSLNSNTGLQLNRHKDTDHCVEKRERSHGNIFRRRSDNPVTAEPPNSDSDEFIIEALDPEEAGPSNSTENWNVQKRRSSKSDRSDVNNTPIQSRVINKYMEPDHSAFKLSWDKVLTPREPQKPALEKLIDEDKDTEEESDLELFYLKSSVAKESRQSSSTENWKAQKRRSSKTTRSDVNSIPIPNMVHDKYRKPDECVNVSKNSSNASKIHPDNPVTQEPQKQTPDRFLIEDTDPEERNVKKCSFKSSVTEDARPSASTESWKAKKRTSLRSDVTIPNPKHLVRDKYLEPDHRVQNGSNNGANSFKIGQDNLATQKPQKQAPAETEDFLKRNREKSPLHKFGRTSSAAGKARPTAELSETFEIESMDYIDKPPLQKRNASPGDVEDEFFICDVSENDTFSVNWTRKPLKHQKVNSATYAQQNQTFIVSNDVHTSLNGASEQLIKKNTQNKKGSKKTNTQTKLSEESSSVRSRPRRKTKVKKCNEPLRRSTRQKAKMNPENVPKSMTRFNAPNRVEEMDSQGPHEVNMEQSNRNGQTTGASTELSKATKFGRLEDDENNEDQEKNIPNSSQPNLVERLPESDSDMETLSSPRFSKIRGLKRQAITNAELKTTECSVKLRRVNVLESYQAIEDDEVTVHKTSHSSPVKRLSESDPNDYDAIIEAVVSGVADAQESRSSYFDKRNTKRRLSKKRQAVSDAETTERNTDSTRVKRLENYPAYEDDKVSENETSQSRLPESNPHDYDTIIDAVVSGVAEEQESSSNDFDKRRSKRRLSKKRQEMKDTTWQNTKPSQVKTFEMYEDSEGDDDDDIFRLADEWRRLNGEFDNDVEERHSGPKQRSPFQSPNALDESPVNTRSSSPELSQPQKLLAMMYASAQLLEDFTQLAEQVSLESSRSVSHMPSALNESPVNSEFSFQSGIVSRTRNEGHDKRVPTSRKSSDTTLGELHMQGTSDRESQLPMASVYDPETDCQFLQECVYRMSNEDIHQLGDNGIRSCLENNVFSSGKIIIGPMTCTFRSRAGPDIWVVSVIQGTVKVTLCASRYVLSAGDFFFVPPGNAFSIKNRQPITAELVYTRLKNRRA